MENLILPFLPNLSHPALLTAGLTEVIVLATVFPPATYNEVCRNMRPDWDGGRVTLFEELLHFLATLPALALLCLWAAALYSGKLWTAYVVAVIMVVVAVNTMLETAVVDSIIEGIEVGCVGSPELISMLLALMGIILIARAHWKT